MNCTIDGININYIDEGSGETLLLLHGWGSSVDAWRLMIREFSPSFRLVAPDLPGFGGSDMPPESWDVEGYASFVMKFINTLGLRDPILVGHSFGGRIIIKLAGTGRVAPDKIILIDSAGVKPKKTLKQKCRTRVFKIAKGALTLPGIKNYTGELLDRVRAHFGSADYNAAPEVLRHSLVKAVNEDLTHHMPNITASTLLIFGEKDTATPVSDGQLMESLIGDSGLCIIKGAGHFSFVERPYEVHAIIHSFLGK